MKNTPKEPGALSLIAEQLPKWWADEGTKDLRDGLSNFVPTDAVDAGLMLVGGPGGKMARKAGAALITGGASTDAQAGTAAKLVNTIRALTLPDSWIGKQFYRGVPRLDGSDVQSVSGLHVTERPRALSHSPHLKANTGSYAWASDNPNAAESYTHKGGVMIPLRMNEEPGAIIDAAGANWRDAYFAGDKKTLNPEFKDAFTDPGVRSILVRNVSDPGSFSTSNAFIERMAQQLHGKPYAQLTSNQRDELIYNATIGNNLLIKDPKSVNFSITGEPGRFAEGGPVSKPMEHTTSSSQDASTQPLTGSALKALVRGWIAGTAGSPGDIEGLARKGINWSFGPGGVNVDESPALPTSKVYKDWLPGKQQGDEMISDIGSVFGGVGATKLVSLTKGALSRVAAAAPGPMAGSRAAMRGVMKVPDADPAMLNRIKDMLKQSEGAYSAPRSASDMFGMVVDSVDSLKRIAARVREGSGMVLEQGAYPTYAHTKRAFDQGFTLPGARMTPYGDAALIHKLATTPGAHFAPMGSEDQLAELFLKYFNEGVENFKPAFNPRMSVVYARPEGVLKVEDEMAEFPGRLLSNLGVLEQMRAANPSSRVIDSAAASELARKYGVNTLVYDNAVEGVGGAGSRLFPGIENPSVSVLNQGNIREAATFAAGGSVQGYEEGGSVSGGDSDSGSDRSWGSEGYGRSIAGLNFAGGVSTGQYGSPASAAETFTANPDGTYSLADTVQRAGLSDDDAATLAAITNLTQGDLTSINAAYDLGYRSDPNDQSVWSKLGIIPGMSQDAFFGLQAQVPGAQDARMTAFNNYVTAPLAQALMAATPLGTMTNAASAFNSYNDTGDTSALQNFAGGMLGNFAGAKAAQLTGMRALSPMVSSAVKGAVKGGADGAVAGAVDGVGNAAASTVNSYTASTLANALGISPAQANALLGVTGGSQAVGSAVKGALSRAVR